MTKEINCSVNEIWKCKTHYVDSHGLDVKSSQDYYVCIKSGPFQEGEDKFVRVQLISISIDQRSQEDILIDDKTILESPFIIEPWNEQPMLTSILDKCLGKVEIQVGDESKQKQLTQEQKDFRKSEVRRAAFLYQSILSNLSWNEQKQKGRIISMNTIKKLSVAASIAGLVFLAWQPGKLQNEKFQQKYYSNYNKPFDFEKEGAVPSRGNYYLIPEFDDKESIKIQEAMQAFQTSDFKMAVAVFSEIKDLDKNKNLFFYYGLSLYELSEVTKCIAVFEELNESIDLVFKEDLLFYLGLAYVNNNNMIKARKIFKELENKQSKYTIDYPELIKDLRWF